jgi:alpha,alpha-trehalase
MPMRVDPEIILDKFYALTPKAKQDRDALSQFVNEHFLPPGSELVEIQPQDFTETPSVLASLTPNSTYYGWAQFLNQAFASLTRKVSEDVFLNPQRYSILRRTHPVVIPGGRFRESYYWDSYWIVLGLLACDMKETARGLVQNLLDDVANFGFVPNGGRIYYLNRSQPPLLSEMVLALLEADEALMKGKRVVMGVALVAFIFEGIRSWCFPPLPSVRPSSF